MWQIWFVLPCAFLFFLLTLFVGVFDSSIVLQTFVIILLSFLLLPAYYDKLPRKWAAPRKVRTHLVFSLSVILLLHLAYVFRLGVMKEKSFDHRLGYNSGPFRTIYSVAPFQFAIHQLYQLAPLRYRVRISLAEDAARVHKIEEDLSSETKRSLVCPNKELTECLLKVMRASVKAAPLGSAGILAFEKNAKANLLEEVRSHPENYYAHVKLSGELQKFIVLMASNPDTEIRSLVSGIPQKGLEAELKELLKKEKKRRFTLVHSSAVIPERRTRQLAGK